MTTPASCVSSTSRPAASGRSLYQSVSAVAGKAGSNLQGFTGLIDSTRNLTQGLNLRKIIEEILEVSGLNEFYRNDKDGAERLENLGELINAAEAFVTQEG